jgi:HK97 family phage portal protein
MHGTNSTEAEGEGNLVGLLTRIAHRLNQPMPAMQVRANYSFGMYQVGRPIWGKANLSTYLKAYDQVVVVFSAINLIADAAASAKVRVYDESKDNTELPNHPLRALLRTPNAYMSESEFYNAMVKIAAVTGFAVAEKERSTAGRPVALHPLRSDWLQPIPRDDNMTDWQYQPPGADKQTLLGEDVIVWTYQGSPKLDPTGISPLCAANREIGIDTAMTDFTKAFFDSGGIPTIGLVTDPDAELDQAEGDIIREKFKQIRGQPWEPIILQSIKDVKRLGFDLNEMAYKDLRHLTATQICSAFRIHPLLIDLLVGLENAPWSEFRTARRSFYEDTISPLWSRLDGALTRSLLPDFESNENISLEFDTSAIPALQDDDTARWQLISNPGASKIATVNELRAEVDLPPISGGDVRILSIADIEVPATVQNGQRSNGHASIVAGPDKGQWSPISTAKPPITLHIPPGTWTAETIELGPNDRVIGARALPSGAMYRLPAEQRAKVATHAKNTIARLGDRSAPLLRAFWKEQGQRVLSSLGLRGNDHAPDLRDVANINWDEEARLLRQEMTKVYAMSGKAAFNDVSELLNIDVSFDLANPNVGRVLTRLGQRVTDITETTRADVQRVVGDSLNEGTTLSELGDRLSSLFVETYASRAETVGRTESMIAYNKASVLGYQESGVVGMAELVDNPAHTEDYGASDGLTCADRDGLLVQLDSVDTHIDGEHPNGSLAVIPVLSTALGEE